MENIFGSGAALSFRRQSHAFRPVNPTLTIALATLPSFLCLQPFAPVLFNRGFFRAHPFPVFFNPILGDCDRGADVILRNPNPTVCGLTAAGVRHHPPTSLHTLTRARLQHTKQHGDVGPPVRTASLRLVHPGHRQRDAAAAHFASIPIGQTTPLPSALRLPHASARFTRTVRLPRSANATMSRHYGSFIAKSMIGTCACARACAA